MPVNFYLDKRPNRKGLCPILTSISIKGCRLLTSIGYSIPPERWDRKRMEMKRGAGTSDELPPSVVNSRIEEIRSVFRSFELNTRCRPSSETLKMMIADIKGESHPEGGGPTVMQCFTEYLKYGTTSRQWAEGSLKNNETLQRHLNGWEHQSFEDLIDDGCVSFL
ncbi:MAG: Arm DNA-binding domain-containing protein, partial [Candidatus Cryptobacteroides sp.]